MGLARLSVQTRLSLQYKIDEAAAATTDTSTTEGFYDYERAFSFMLNAI